MLTASGLTGLVLILSFHPSNFVLGIDAIRPAEAISIWTSLTMEDGGAYSSLIEHGIVDCMRPRLVDCFSIQQNTWITDSMGNYVLWAQNVVQLARLDAASYYGTFTFQVWNAKGGRAPLLCEPGSGQVTSCRAPFYTIRVPFPTSFTFHSHIDNQAAGSVLQMSNSLGEVEWKIPTAIDCPCYTETVPESPPPWGHSPFELVAVGLDSLAMAIFRNSTVGRIGPVEVQSSDGLWHNASTTTLGMGLLATAETSMNLAWNSTTGEFHWSQGMMDQGVAISGISEASVAAPKLPNPHQETYLYAEFSSTYAYLTILDSGKRALGVDPQSGKTVEAIPNSSIAHDSSEDLLIVNPEGQYTLVITAGGNTAFNLFLSKATNTGFEFGTRNYNGTLPIGYSASLRLDADSMNLRVNLVQIPSSHRRNRAGTRRIRRCNCRHSHLSPKETCRGLALGFNS
jgi:hypothetical protein